MSRPAPDSAAEHDAKRRRQETDSELQSARQPTSDEPRVSNPSVAQRCHADALHCIFAFLQLRHLPGVMQSCRDWYAAAVKAPPRDFSATIRSPASVARLAASPLRRHVAEVDAGSFATDVAQLRQLHSMPRLTALRCVLDGDDLYTALGAVGGSREQHAQPLRDALPPQLRNLDIEIFLVYGSDWRTQVMQALLDALPTLAQLTDLRLRSFDDESLHLFPLVQLPLLRRLELDLQLTARQCADVKQLVSLETLDGGDLFDDAAALQSLLTPPHSLQRLESIGLGGCCTVDLPIMRLLLQLPALTELAPADLRPECWVWLRGLTQLRKVRFWHRTPFTADQLAALGASLNALPHLSHLIVLSSLHADYGRLPLQLRLPALRRLSLFDVRVQLLAFLQHSPLLEELRLINCMGMGGSDVMAPLRAHPPSQLRLLQLLQTPHVQPSDRIALSAEQKAVLQPPSSLLPSLREFEYGCD